MTHAAGLLAPENAALLAAVIATLDAAARLAGGSLETVQADTAWQPDLDSPALAVTRRVYERLHGEPPIVTAVHAWLDGRDRQQGSRPRHDLLRPPDRSATLARRARQHPTVARFWRLLACVVDELSAA